MKYLRLLGVIALFLLLSLLLTMFYGLPLTVLLKTVGDGFLYYYANELAMLGAFFTASWIMLKPHWVSRMGFSLKGRGRDIAAGAVVALLIYAVGFGLLWAVGSIEVVGVHFSAPDLLLSWGLMLLVALAGESALRGFVLGRMLDAGVNRFVALFLSSVLFSAMHLFNPNFAFLPFLNILLAGVLLGASYIYTRNLWFPVSLHLFWNWFQGAVFGFSVSGNDMGVSLIEQRLPEATLLNGGAFGFEGSWLCTVLMIVATAIILKAASSRCASAPYQSTTPAP